MADSWSRLRSILLLGFGIRLHEAGLDKAREERSVHLRGDGRDGAENGYCPYGWQRILHYKLDRANQIQSNLARYQIALIQEFELAGIPLRIRNP